MWHAKEDFVYLAQWLCALCMQLVALAICCLLLTENAQLSLPVQFLLQDQETKQKPLVSTGGCKQWSRFSRCCFYVMEHAYARRHALQEHKSSLAFEVVRPSACFASNLNCEQAVTGN